MTLQGSQAHCGGCWCLLCSPSQQCPTTSGGAPSIWACSATTHSSLLCPGAKGTHSHCSAAANAPTLSHPCLPPRHSCPATDLPNLGSWHPNGVSWTPWWCLEKLSPKEPQICTSIKSRFLLHPLGQLNYLQHEGTLTVRDSQSSSFLF